MILKRIVLRATQRASKQCVSTSVSVCLVLQKLLLLTVNFTFYSSLIILTSLYFFASILYLSPSPYLRLRQSLYCLTCFDVIRGGGSLLELNCVSIVFLEGIYHLRIIEVCAFLTQQIPFQICNDLNVKHSFYTPFEVQGTLTNILEIIK